MVNKRRARKIQPPYKKYSGPGLPVDKPETEESFDEADATPEAPTELISVGDRGEAAFGAPPEILKLILGYCDTLWPFLTINSKWYSIVLPMLYLRPQLSSRNFGEFVTAITRHRHLGNFVSELDLTEIVQTGKNSVTSRLLTRCAPRLELFIAPQCNFGYSPLLSLRNCKRLKILDLGMVSERVDLPALILAVQEFRDLEVMRFPRSSIECETFDLQWPPNLRALALSGGLTPEFLECTYTSHGYPIGAFQYPNGHHQFLEQLISSDWFSA